MSSFPAPQILDRELRVRILLCLFADVDHDQWDDQHVQGDLVCGHAIWREMEGRVHVGAGMLHQMPAVHLKAVRVKTKQGFDLQVGVTEVGGKVLGDDVGQVDGSLKGPPDDPGQVDPFRLARRVQGRRGNHRTCRQRGSCLEEVTPREPLHHDLSSSGNAHKYLRSLNTKGEITSFKSYS